MNDKHGTTRNNIDGQRKKEDDHLLRLLRIYRTDDHSTRRAWLERCWLRFQVENYLASQRPRGH